MIRLSRAWLARIQTIATFGFFLMLAQFAMAVWGVGYLEDWLARPIALLSLVLFFFVGGTCLVVGAAARVVLIIWRLRGRQ